MRLWIGPEKQRVLTERLRLIRDKISWTTRVSGVLLSVLSMHFLVVRPLVQRVDKLQSELTFVDSALEKVNAERATIHETNDLLSTLKSQHEEVAGARATIRQLQKLRDELVHEADQFPAAMRAVSRLSELPDHVFQAEADRYSHLVPNSSKKHAHQLLELSAPFKLNESFDFSAQQRLRKLGSKVVSMSRQLPAQEEVRQAEEWEVTITEQQ